MESNPAERKCPKCGGDMEAGFIRDRERGAVRPAEWAEGVPETSWLGYVKVDDAVCYQVEAFRCEKCGYLEQYAVAPPPKTGIL